MKFGERLEMNEIEQTSRVAALVTTLCRFLYKVVEVCTLSSAVQLIYFVINSLRRFFVVDFCVFVVSFLLLYVSFHGTCCLKQNR